MASNYDLLNIDLVLGIPSEPYDLAAEEAYRQSVRQNFYYAGLLTLWEVQGQIAAFVLLALVAIAPIWVGAAIMILWSLLATSVYAWGRLRGLPDTLESKWSRPTLSRGRWQAWARATGLSAVKTWLAGISPFIYTRAFVPFLARPATCRRLQVARYAVLGIGLTLFGVTTAHHLLRKAGLPERHALRLSFVGPFLNVPYRIFASAIFLNGIWQFASRTPI